MDQPQKHEEQQESGKKNQVEEKIVNDDILNFSLIAKSKKSRMDGYYLIGHIDYTSEIYLPPPESNS